MVEAILVSTGVVAFAELGDKTQLLAILLAARFRAPLPISLGILVSTAANHVLAAIVGDLAGARLSEDVLRWILIVSFATMAVWTLLPDRMEGEARAFSRFGAFGATAISFFLVEMGDKTQVATLALAARFHSVLFVATGTTLGVMIADVPAVYLGEIVTKAVPVKWMRLIAAAIFAALALAAALDWGGRFLYA